MSFYYCYLLDAGGKIVARELLEAADDSDAAARAQSYLEAHPKIPAVELWFGPRLVQVLRRPPAAA